MLFYVQMRWNHEGRISLDELWDIEAQETEHAQETIDSGLVVGIWKVADRPMAYCPMAQDSKRASWARLGMRPRARA